jgi:hypothetical protein
MVTNKKGYMREYRLKHPDYVRKSIEWDKEYQHQNPDKTRQYSKETYKHLKIAVLSHYSKGQPCCGKCGETQLRKLNLDHINEDGHEHRKTVSSGKQILLWARRNGFPKTLQVPCHKCNSIKYHLAKRRGIH